MDVNTFLTIFGILANIATVIILIITMLAYKRNSFDSVFTRLLENHNTTFSKASASAFHRFFIDFKEEFKNKESIRAEDIDKFYEKYTDNDNFTYLQLYFKFIYYEITTVNRSNCMKRKTKKFYVRLIQSQMSNEELFCYLINQIKYCSGRTDYKDFLKEMGFFDDLCKSRFWGQINKIKTILLEPLIDKNLLN